MFEVQRYFSFLMMAPTIKGLCIPVATLCNSAGSCVCSE